MATQDQLDTLLNSDALSVTLGLMRVIVGYAEAEPGIAVVMDPLGVIIEMAGPLGSVRFELYPRTGTLQ